MRRREKNSKSVLQLRLWVVDVCPESEQGRLSVVLLAESMQDALAKAEHRYPMFFTAGTRGFAIEADHAAFSWAEGEFNTIEVGRWWGEGYLPRFSKRGKVQ
jgi:hypothetical protein